MGVPLRVLLVEDSRADAELLLLELRAGGFNPVWKRVDTPEAMRETLERGAWDIILSDYVMPRFSGLAALELAQEMGIDLPFIIVTGQVGEETAVAAMRAGAHDYVLKGNLTRLGAAVQRELREAEVRRERRRAEEELRRAHATLERRVEERTKELAAEQERLAITLRSIGDGVIATDTQGKVTLMNEVAEHLTGWEEEEATGRPLTDVFHIIDEQSRALLENPVASVLKTGAVVGLANNTVLVARDGAERIIADSAAPVRSEDGVIVGVVLVFRDVTERKREEAERERLLKQVQFDEARWRTLADNMPDMVTMCDAEGHVTYINPAQSRLFGYQTKPGLALEEHPVYYQVYHPDGTLFAPEDLPLQRAALYGEEARDVEIVLRTPSGEERITVWDAAPLRDPEGRIIGAVAAGRDITERKQAEEELRRSQTLLAEAERLSHTGAWEWDIASSQWIFSDEWLAIHGCRKRMLSPEELLPIAHPDDRARIERAFEEVRNGIGPYDIEHRIIRQDTGEVRIVRAYGQLLREAQGAPVKVLGVAQDVTEQKRSEEERWLAEEALQESEAKYRNLFMNMTEEVHFWKLVRDEEGRIKTWRLVDANPPTLKTWGKTLDEIKGETTDEIFGPGATDHYMAVVQKIMTEGVPYTFEDYFPNLDKYFRFTSVPLGDYFITTGADITDIKKANEALRASEERLKRSQEIAHLGSWELDLIHDRLTWSDEVYRIFGLQPQEFGASYEAFLEWVHPDDRAAVDAAYTGSLRENRDSYEIEHRVVRKSTGEIRFVHEKCEHLRDATGRITRSVGMVHDITERKRAEEERQHLLETVRNVNERLVLTGLQVKEQAELVERERQRLETVLATVPVGVVMVEPDGRAALANRSAEFLLGMPKEQIGATLPPGYRFQRPTGEPYPVDELPPTRALNRGDSLFGIELVVTHPDGRTLHLLASSVPITDDEGRIIAAVAAFVNVTPLRELERQREEFISVVAHDLRGALTAIKGFAELLARPTMKDTLPRTAHRPVEGIVSGSRRLERMIVDLLDVSRIEARQLALDKEPVDLSSLVRAIIQRSEELTKGHAVKMEVHGDIPQLEVDPDRIEQVLTNLLSNAGKYSYPDTEIRVEVERRGNEVMVSATNLGPGVLPEDKEKLFTRFHRTQQAKDEKVPGLGLGLYIAKGLVEAHGGHIWVESKPGEYATFRFILPVEGPVS